jgi:hypothetical protein
MPVVEPVVVALRQRARADQGHLAADHVEQLRQLVERPAAQQAPHACHARVLADLEQRAADLVVLLEALLQVLGAVDHRAELEARERPAADAGPHRPVQERSARRDLDRERRQRHERRERHDQQRRADHVERALDREVDPVEDRRLELEQRQRLPGHELHPVHQDLHGGRGHAHAHAVLVALVDQLDGLGLGEVCVGDQHLVDGVEVTLELLQRAEVAQPVEQRDRRAGDEAVGLDLARVAQRVRDGLDV